MRSEVELAFADGVYLFRLTLPGIAEIQRKSKAPPEDAGFGAISARIMAGRYLQQNGPPFGNPIEARYRIEELIEIVRQALIGGGKGKVDGEDIEVDGRIANHLIENYVVPPAQPIKVAWDLAASIILATTEGLEETEEASPLKKKGTRRGGSTTVERSPTSRSVAPRQSKPAT